MASHWASRNASTVCAGPAPAVLRAAGAATAPTPPAPDAGAAAMDTLSTVESPRLSVSPSCSTTGSPTAAAQRLPDELHEAAALRACAPCQQRCTYPHGTPPRSAGCRWSCQGQRTSTRRPSRPPRRASATRWGPSRTQRCLWARARFAAAQAARRNAIGWPGASGRGAARVAAIARADDVQRRDGACAPRACSLKTAPLHGPAVTVRSSAGGAALLLAFSLPRRGGMARCGVAEGKHCTCKRKCNGGRHGDTRRRSTPGRGPLLRFRKCGGHASPSRRRPSRCQFVEDQHTVFPKS